MRLVRKSYGKEWLSKWVREKGERKMVFGVFTRSSA